MPEILHNMSVSVFVIHRAEGDMCGAHIWHPVSQKCIIAEKEPRDC